MTTNEIVQIVSTSIVISGMLLYITLAIISRKKIMKEGWAEWYFSLGRSNKKENE